MNHPARDISGTELSGRPGDGHVVIPAPTPLTRLNFVDGRPLYGADLTLEQTGERELVFALGRTGGPGVASGLDVLLSGETLSVSPGLAVDPHGRILLLPYQVSVTVADLLTPAGAVRQQGGAGGFGPCGTGGGTGVPGLVEHAELYLLTASWAEGFRGNLELYGAGCEQARGASTARPYRVEGLALHLRPLTLASPLPASSTVLMRQAHLRSRVAAAYFADERASAGLPMSAAVLASASWCAGAPGPSGTEVPLAVVARYGQNTLFADGWTARRERMDTPARAFSDGRLAMRPRNVFAAQIAQFQSQLSAGLPDSGLGRILVDAGMVEVSPAGYLPVDPARDVVQQARALFGPGVDLRFLLLPPDQIPHEVEAVQHRDRISLIAGLDDPSNRPEVDVLVPDGLAGFGQQPTGRRFSAVARLTAPRQTALEARGLARLAPRRTPGFALAAAGLANLGSQAAGLAFVSGLIGLVLGRQTGPMDTPRPGRSPLTAESLRTLADDAGLHAARVGAASEAPLFSATFAANESKPMPVRVALTCDHDPWDLRPGEPAHVSAQLDVYSPGGVAAAALFRLFAQMEVEAPAAGATRRFLFHCYLTANNGTGSTTSRNLDFALTVTLTEQSGERLYSIRVATAGTRATLRIGNDGSLEVSLGDTLTAELREDSAAFNPDDPRYQTADPTLRLLRGAYVSDPGFYERAHAALFGTGGEPADGPYITATRDWVAFRRSRIDQTPPTPPSARGVVVWVASASDAGEAAEWEKAVVSGIAARLPWQRVRTVLFDPGTARVRTPAEELRQGYIATGAATTIRFVGYGAAGTMPAGKDRSIAITAALPPAAALDWDAEAREVSPPGALLEADSDGSVLIIAYPLATGAVEVLGLNTDPGDSIVQEVRIAVLERLPGAVDRNVGGVVSRLGMIRTAGRRVEQRTLDSALATTRDAVRGKVMRESTPVLWIDPTWMAANQDDAKLLIDAVGRLLTGVDTQAAPRPLTLVDLVQLPLDTSARQAMLIILYGEGGA